MGETRGSPQQGFELLLGELPSEHCEDARRLVTYLRLLRDDGRGLRAEAVGLDVAGTCSELEQREKRRALELHADLLRIHLEAALERDSFQAFGVPRRSLTTLWSDLARLADRGVLPVSIPRPGEPPLDLARRLLAACLELGPDAGWHSVWSGRLVTVREGAQAAEEHWRRLLESARSEGRIGLEVACVEALANGELDAFRVRAAREVLDERPFLLAVSSELAWLRARVAVLLGDAPSASEWVHGQASPEGSLPAPLVELREQVPAWAPFLIGRPPSRTEWTPWGLVRHRARLGASLLGVFSIGEGQRLRTHLLDMAPGSRERVLANRRLRADAHLEVGSPEHRALLEARPVFLHRNGARELSAALAGQESQAVALFPLLDSLGEPRGWLHVESEHHLLPCEARGRELAAAWWAELQRDRSQRDSRVSQALPVREPGLLDAQPTADAWIAEQARDRLSRLPLKLARRRALLFAWDERARARGVPSLLASCGDGLVESGKLNGRGLARCLRTGASLIHRGEPELALLSGARSGVFLPVTLAGEVHSLLVVESGRAADFGSAEVALATGFAEKESLVWRLLQFRAWHRERFDRDVRLDPNAHVWKSVFSEWLTLARSGEPLVLHGPRGSGKRTMAHWLHFEGAGSDAPVWEGVSQERSWREWAQESEDSGRAGTGTWILEGGDLAEGARRRLGESLSDGIGVRPLVLLEPSTEGGSGAGALGPRLAARFEGFELSVPALRHRRDEIPELAKFLAIEEVRLASRDPVSFSCAALELLWRQTWEGNVEQLGSWVRRLSITHPGAEIREAELERFARLTSRKLKARLPSLRPRREDVILALASTKRANGAWNRTAAARLLGWDPGTLQARLAHLGMEPPA